MDEQGQFTAVGFCLSGTNGCCGVKNSSREIVVEVLTQYLGNKPDHVLLLQNGEFGPDVIAHWNS